MKRKLMEARQPTIFKFSDYNWMMKFCGLTGKTEDWNIDRLSSVTPQHVTDIRAAEGFKTSNIKWTSEISNSKETGQPMVDFRGEVKVPAAYLGRFFLNDGSHPQRVTRFRDRFLKDREYDPNWMTTLNLVVNGTIEDLLIFRLTSDEAGMGSSYSFVARNTVSNTEQLKDFVTELFAKGDAYKIPAGIELKNLTTNVIDDREIEQFVETDPNKNPSGTYKYKFDNYAAMMRACKFTGKIDPKNVARLGESDMLAISEKFKTSIGYGDWSSSYDDLKRMSSPVSNVEIRVPLALIARIIGNAGTSEAESEIPYLERDIAKNGPGYMTKLSIKVEGSEAKSTAVGTGNNFIRMRFTSYEFGVGVSLVFYAVNSPQNHDDVREFITSIFKKGDAYKISGGVKTALVVKL